MTLHFLFFRVVLELKIFLTRLPHEQPSSAKKKKKKTLSTRVNDWLAI